MHQSSNRAVLQGAVAESWTATIDAAAMNWIVARSLSGVQAALAAGGVEYTSDIGQVTFTIFESGTPANGDVITFSTSAADPLTSSGTPGAIDDGDIQVAGGDVLTVEHLGGNGEIVADLVTTAGSAVVTSSSSVFVTNGVIAGDSFVIGTGQDAGNYTVSSVYANAHQRPPSASILFMPVQLSWQSN